MKILRYVSSLLVSVWFHALPGFLSMYGGLRSRDAEGPELTQYGMLNVLDFHVQVAYLCLLQLEKGLYVLIRVICML